MSEILALATAGLKNGQLEDINHVEFPRVDYIELSKFGIDVIDYGSYDWTYLGRTLRNLEVQLRSDPYLAWLGVLKEGNYRMVFAMSERAGIPFAAFQKAHPNSKRFISMFTCWSKRQELAITRLGLFSSMDAIIVKCQSLKDHFLSLGVPGGKIHLIPYSIDQHFFKPSVEIRARPGFVLSLGEIRTRDYNSLFQAVQDLPVELFVAASGSWYAREKHKNLNIKIPDNVSLSQGIPLSDLRNCYSQSQFAVFPLYDHIFSAGATGILEAMSMGRAVITTRSRGILDYVIDGETGILVDVGDTQGLKEAIEYLLAHPKEACRMGENGRQWVTEELNLDNYIDRILHALKQTLNQSPL